MVEQRSNATPQSRADPEALLAKKGKGNEARLATPATRSRRNWSAAFESRNGLARNSETLGELGLCEPATLRQRAPDAPLHQRTGARHRA
jgi:hypothetical protein